MIGTEHIGLTVPPYTVAVEASRLRFFAKATGQTDPVYVDDDAARAAGHPGLPVPPTFLFCLEMDAPEPGALRRQMGIDIALVLHGEQRFRYHRMAFAGDRLSFAQQVTDIYSKKGGLLDFMVRETRVSNQRGEHVADLVATTVIRHGEMGRGAVPAQAAAPVGQPAFRDAAARRPETHDFRVGDALPPFTTEALTRTTLALYCGASGDHNPVHVDIDFARQAGYPDVFAHGMLSMAWLGRLLTNGVPQHRIREFGVRFTALTQVGEAITCSGRVTEVFEQDGERRARLAIQTANAQGQVKLAGDATIALA